jgi:hypothetical protein
MGNKAARIPSGIYCYNKAEDHLCPYWGYDPTRPEQESGYCEFLGINDWDDVEGVPLLWDQVKECGCNVSEDGLDPLMEAAFEWRAAEVHHGAVTLGVRGGDPDISSRRVEDATTALRIAIDRYKGVIKP